MSSDFVKAVNCQIPGFHKEEESSWNGPYFFIFAADPQPGLIDMIDGGKGSKWDIELERTAKALTVINRMQPKPRFVLIGGDIVDAFPGTEHHDQQVSDLKQAFSQLDVTIPLLAISGNHDVGNVPTCETILEYRNDFGEEYYSFWVGGVFFIALNSQYMFDSSKIEEIAETQRLWLETQLQSAKDNSYVHVVVFMHIPLFLNNAEEEDTYFVIPKQQRISMLEQFADAGVKKVFCGHYHRNAGGVWSRTNADGITSKIEVVVTSAIGAQLGDDEPGIRVVKVLEKEISHQYYSFDDVPQIVELK